MSIATRLLLIPTPSFLILFLLSVYNCPAINGYL